MHTYISLIKESLTFPFIKSHSLCLCMFLSVCWNYNFFPFCSQAVIRMHRFSILLANGSRHTTLNHRPDITALPANTDLLDHSATTHDHSVLLLAFTALTLRWKPKRRQMVCHGWQMQSFPWKTGLHSVYKQWQMFLAMSLIDDVIIKSVAEAQSSTHHTYLNIQHSSKSSFCSQWQVEP